MQGLQTVRILSGYGIPVIAVAADRHHSACFTNVCRRIIYSPTSGDALTNTLIELGPQLGSKAVLVTCEDGSVSTVSRDRDRLREWFYIAMPDDETVAMLADKARFHAFAEEKGFPVPMTRIVRSKEDLERVAGEMKYPCVVKPPARSGQWSRNTYVKAFEAAGPRELKAIYDKYHAWADALLVQQWIEGDDSALYSYNCYLDADSEPLASFVAAKLRQWPVRTGQSSLGVECRNDTVLELSKRFFRECGHMGLGYMEVKQDARNGEYYLVEPNVCRPTGRSAIAEAGGVELLYTMYCHITGRPLPENREQLYGNVKWIHLRRDLQASFVYWRRGELTLREWWVSLKGRKAYAVWSRRDPKPFFMDIYEVFRSKLSRRERRKRLNTG